MARAWGARGGSCPSFRRQRGRSDGRMRRNGAGYGRCFVSRTGRNSATKHPVGWVRARWGARARRCACSGQAPGRGAALPAIARKKSALVHVPPRLVHVRGGVGKFDFFFASRFYLELAGAIPDAPARVLPGCVVGVRIWGGCWLTFRVLGQMQARSGRPWPFARLLHFHLVKLLGRSEHHPVD